VLVVMVVVVFVAFGVAVCVEEVVFVEVVVLGCEEVPEVVNVELSLIGWEPLCELGSVGVLVLVEEVVVEITGMIAGGGLVR